MLHHRLRTLGKGPTSSIALLLCHATGFNHRVFAPLEACLENIATAANQSVHCLSIDFTGHGGSFKRARGVDGRDWANFLVDDVRDAVKLLPDGVTSVCGVGHSMGAAALCLADIHAVASFSSLVLFEPVIFPPAAMFAGGNALSVQASNRNCFFPTREAAAAYWRPKGLFKRWHDLAFEGYLDGGLMPSADRFDADDPPEPSVDVDTLTLTCDRRFESAIFAGGHVAWDRTNEMTVPHTLLVWGEDTEFGRPHIEPKQLFDLLCERIPRSTVLTMDGCGHMGPMEKPQHLARIIADELRWTRSSKL